MTMRSSEEILRRMEELMRPIDMQIMMCDNTDDVLMLASSMLTTAKSIYVQQLGAKAAKEVISLMLKHMDDEDGIPLG